MTSRLPPSSGARFRDGAYLTDHHRLALRHRVRRRRRLRGLNCTSVPIATVVRRAAQVLAVEPVAVLVRRLAVRRPLRRVVVRVALVLLVLTTARCLERTPLRHRGAPLLPGTLIATDDLPCMQVLTTAPPRRAAPSRRSVPTMTRRTRAHVTGGAQAPTGALAAGRIPICSTFRATATWRCMGVAPCRLHERAPPRPQTR